MIIQLQRLQIIYLLGLAVLFACSGLKTDSLKPKKYEKGNGLTAENGNLRAVFVDNSALPPRHKSGYNGIAELYHTLESKNLFVPEYAGFNLEHIFGGDSLHQLFEPRLHPMELFRKSDREILLYQKATSLSGVESLTQFTLVKPHYIDITFQCILHNRSFFHHDYAGLFWASYIQHPDDKKIYFKGVAPDSIKTPSWIAAYSDKHGVNSTHRGIKDNHDFFFAKNFNARLPSHFSDIRFTEPFYFGRFGKMVLAYFFDTNEIIRFSQSPTGGGEFNPAWDFQYIIPFPEAEKKYFFKVRMLYKPFISKEDIKEEYEKWER